jgi:hypothetical protein
MLTRTLTTRQTDTPARDVTALAEAARANVILATLPRELREELVSHALDLPLAHGDLVEVQGGPNRVFFPLSGLLTGVRYRDDGTRFAYLHRGREGAANAIGVARPEVNTGGCDLVVDVPGRALVLSVPYYRSILEVSQPLMRAVLSHASYTIAWREQSADCHGHHPVQARTAYFLLLLRAHVHGDSIETTHARIAEVLGVRRQSISEALGSLRAQGVIAAKRGRIVVRDGAALWRQACECRGIVEDVLRLQSDGLLSYTG